MRVLITGANGFIGSHVAKVASAEGAQIFALVRNPEKATRLRALESRVTLVSADLENPPTVEEVVRVVRPEVCIHAAWYAIPGKYPNAPENLDCVAATLNLARQLASHSCRRFVGVGTCWEYNTDNGWLSEASPTVPAQLYSASKLATMLMLEQFSRQSGLSFAWARLFYQYGPFEDEGRLVPAVVRGLLKGEEVPLTAGAQVRDYLHVEDVAAAIWAIAQSELLGPVNVGSGQPVTVRGVVETIAAIIGRPDLLRFGARAEGAADPPFICANTKKLRSGTAWSPGRDLETGLRHTIDWWRTDPSRS